ncbi:MULTISPECIES: BTAD domain-containing putative transcriptional regulator [unclassified Nocardia]|uniref:AfsR/SARP family transcriptional regulator n=1 Tax=unclassified Nocardia TaxID=2637762 RepID=UPI001CE46332|nr:MULTISPECIES: BTAD domain-containing putative transcriptional regulator [unclassified Nocardia]
MKTHSSLLAYDVRGMFPDQGGQVGRGQTLTASTGESLVVALLGEIALRRDGALAALPGARSRLLLAALALRPGRSRSAQALIDDVWGEQPPRAPMNALHTQVSRLRAALPDGALEIGPAGYRLALSAEQVDLAAVDELVGAARRCRVAGDVPGCLAAVARARALWRGEPGADLPDGPVADELRTMAAARRGELDDIELAARESTGDLAGALRIARARTAAAPLDEPAQADLMRLLATAGRANEALESFAAFRSMLADELGADPGRALVELNTAILRGEPFGHGASAPGPVVERDGISAVPNHRDTATTVSAAIRTTADGLTYAPVEFALGATRMPESFTASVVPAPIGLRAAPNALLGREADLAELERLLSSSRATTVLGPGGTGKTRVANELGTRVASRQSVVLVELASVRAENIDEARLEIEAAIGAPFGLGERYLDGTAALRGGRTPDVRQRLREALGARPILLILDNCEHLVDAVAVVVADLVGACDRLTVLTTSRAPLMITAEAVYPLPPLTVDAAGSPATDLFIARARAVRPGIRLDPQEIAWLCHTLDGLPLAIELAAARARTMSVQEISTRLRDRFALLRNTDRSSPERHRTLHAVIDWSWNLLDEPQQIALRRLCRFPAGFTLAAAEAVAGGPDLPDVASAIDGLVNQSLLTVLDVGFGTRCRMLETVREYGEEQLAALPGEADLVMSRIVSWARDFTNDAALRLKTPEQVAVVSEISVDLDNLLAAMRYAVERRDANSVYTIFPVLAILWVSRGLHDEVLSWQARVLDLEPVVGQPDSPSGDLHLCAYAALFMHLAHLGDNFRALGRLRVRVRRLLRTSTDLGPLSILFARVMTARSDGRGLFRLIAEATRDDDLDVRSAALIMRANIRENLGDIWGSKLDAERALRFIQPGDLFARSAVSRHLGGVYAQTGQYALSVDHYLEAIDDLRQLGAHSEATETRAMLAAAMVGAGALTEARQQLVIALGSADPDGLVDGGGWTNANPLLATVVAGLAELSLAEGDIEFGLRRFDRALEIFGWPDQALGPGPGGIMIGAAALGARVLHGRAVATEPLMDSLIAHSRVALSQLQDLPQVGCAATVVGSHCVVTGRDIDRGLELLALVPNVYARQDFPSLLMASHVEAARAALGAERVDSVRAKYAHLRRHDSARRIMQLFAELATDL